jgi:flagellar protein FliT
MGYMNVISLYESIAETTSLMLQAAQQQDWDKLAELEICCADYADQIRNYEGESLPREAYLRKLSSIKLILENDKEIRNLMAPWMMKLNSMLRAGHQKANRTLSAGGA